MDAPRASHRTVPVLFDDGIDAVADVEQMRADAANHRRLEDFHRGKARALEAKIDERVAAAAKILTALRRRELMRAGRSTRSRGVPDAAEYRGPERRRVERRGMTIRPVAA